MIMVRLLLTGVLLAVAFFVGYGMGEREQLVVQNSLEQLKDEMARRTLDLERHLTKARVRGHLIEMRETLTLAQQHVRNQDYGLAASTLSEARRSLQAALRIDQSNTIAELQSVDEELNRLAQSVAKLGPRAIEAIDRLKAKISAAS
jgi:hypothetical protein